MTYETSINNLDTKIAIATLEATIQTVEACASTIKADHCQVYYDLPKDQRPDNFAKLVNFPHFAHLWTDEQASDLADFPEIVAAMEQLCARSKAARAELAAATAKLEELARTSQNPSAHYRELAVQEWRIAHYTRVSAQKDGQSAWASDFWARNAEEAKVELMTARRRIYRRENGLGPRAKVDPVKLAERFGEAVA